MGPPPLHEKLGLDFLSSDIFSLAYDIYHHAVLIENAGYRDKGAG